MLITLNVWKEKKQHVQQLLCINFWNFYIVCHILLTPVSSDVCIWRTEKNLLTKKEKRSVIGCVLDISAS